MRMTLTLDDTANSSSLIKRIKMLEGVKDAVEDKDGIDVCEDHGADLAVWLDHGSSVGDVEDLLHGTKGVKKVAILK